MYLNPIAVLIFYVLILFLVFISLFFISLFYNSALFVIRSYLFFIILLLARRICHFYLQMPFVHCKIWSIPNS